MTDSSFTVASTSVSRRRLFQAAGLGAAGAAGLGTMTACKADPGIQGKGEFHGGYPYETPPDGHFNTAGAPYAVVPHVFVEGMYLDLTCMPGGYYWWDKQEWEYFLAESFELDDKENTFTLKVRDGLKWSDGEPLTAKDFETTYWLCWIRSNPMWKSLDSLKATDDMTIEGKLSNPSSVIERYMLKTNVAPSHNKDSKMGKTYRDFAEAAMKLHEDGKDQTSKEGEKLGADLAKFRPENLLTSGPFKLEKKDFTKTQMVLTKNKNGFNADKVKFDKVVVYEGELPQITPLVKDKSVDYASHGFAPNQEKKFKRDGHKIVRPPVYSGPSLYINFKEVPEFKDVLTRRAIAHAINRADAGSIALGDSGPAVKYMAGFSDIMVPDWISKEDQDAFDTYEHDLDKAAELMEKAGWKKDGDVWARGDKKMDYEIKWPSTYADWSACGDAIVDQLTDFGIKLTAQPVDEEQYLEEIDKGEFQMAINVWGSSQHPHPHFAFVADLFTHNTPIAKNNGGDGIAFDLKVKSKKHGEVDLEELVLKAGQGLDEKEQKANVTKVAQVFNELLPIIPICERYSNSPILEGEGNRVKDFPDEDDPIYKNSPYADNPITLGIVTGKITPND
ncbi:ABC transporter substrate-binding protein [Stackebrandtia nassauensis]|uniref:Extracellular solute-binding protein family 5 n=1 Tax=Stackebrandtia nassauensis (strain DSM 44728 / CIP 108903 / NRRL B-16338 / NBRC 102104 / LLR-40K-21) TaxID=446470 RepID=D3QB35_STANL|nr:ABC transporter substrate-binding protein [Stackebrandtia nassauensis]ADD40852.1 extracellular solute-binding protein family 5 [Stackebrandtia nassauensis DSM 44728]